MHRSRCRARGFTMIELMVVVAVVVVLATLLLPAVQKVREAASRSQCANNLRQFALAMHNYYLSYGTFTEGSNLVFADYGGANSHNKGNFIVELLPYLGQEALFQAIRTAPAAPWTNPNSGASGTADAGTVGAAAAAGVLPAGFPLLRCPSDPWYQGNPRVNNYAVCIGPQCMPGNCATVSIFYPYCQPELPVTANNITSGLNDPTYGYTTSSASIYGNPAPSDPVDPVLGSPYVDISPPNVRGMFPRFRMSPAAFRISDISDGLSNTIMLGEKLPSTNGWYIHTYINLAQTVGWASGESDQIFQTLVPINYPWHDPGAMSTDYATMYSPCTDPMNLFNYNTYWGARSWHPGGCNFALADGSVKFISQQIDHKTYELLGCRNDGHRSLTY